jgi:hypothetical protein
VPADAEDVRDLLVHQELCDQIPAIPLAGHDAPPSSGIPSFRQYGMWFDIVK